MSEIEHIFVADADSLLSSLEEISSDSKEADESVKGLGKDSDSSFLSMANTSKIAAAGIAAAAAAVALMVKETLDLSKAANQWAKDAKVLGTSAESVQKLQGAFDMLTDGSVDAVQSLGKLKKGIGEAQTGNKTYIDSLAELGIVGKDAIDKFAGAGPEAQLLALADGYQAAGGSATALVAGSDLLGRSFINLAPALAGGSAELETTFDRLTKAKVVSDETAAAAEELEDALLLLGKTLTYLKSEVFAPLIPIIKDTTESLNELLLVADDEGAVDNLSEALERLGDSLTTSNSDAAAMGDEVGFLGGTLEAALDIVTSSIENIKLLGQVVVDAALAYARFMYAIPGVITGITDLRTEVDVLTGSFDGTAEGARNAAEAFLEIFNAETKGMKATKAANAEREALLKMEEALTKAGKKEAAAAREAALDKIEALKAIKAAEADRDDKAKQEAAKAAIEAARKEAEALRELAAAGAAADAQLKEFESVQDAIAFAAMDADQQIVASAEARVLGLQDATAALLADEKISNEKRLELKQGLDAATDAINAERDEKLLKLEQERVEATIAIEEEKNARLKALDDARFEEQKEMLANLRDEATRNADAVAADAIEAGEAYSEAIDGLVSEFFDATQTFTDMGYDAVTKSGDKMTEDQKDQALALFNINKALAMTQSAVNTALAVSNAIGNAKTLPEAIIAGIAAGVAGGAAQVAIAAEQPPSFAIGGVADEGLAYLREDEGVINPRRTRELGGQEGIDRINRGGGMDERLVVAMQVNNETTFAAEYEALRTGRSPVARAIQASQPTRTGLRVLDM